MMQRLKKMLFADLQEGQLKAFDIYCHAGAGIWLVCVGLGLGFLMEYANRPGEQGQAVVTWPVNDVVARSEAKPTMLLFAHPKCPCTEATLSELKWIMSHCPEKIDCSVLFFNAEPGNEEWEETRHWKQAVAIDGVSVLSDPHSETASLFGVLTSGHVLLYDRDGKLVFEGGITLSRGHRGENPGRETLVSLITSLANGREVAQTPALVGSLGSVTRSTCVFGCPLHSPEVANRPELASLD